MSLVDNPMAEITDYERWLERDNVPTHRGYSVPNLKDIKTEYWDKIGGNAKYILLEGTESTNDAYVFEIPGGERLKVEQHLFEEMIYVVSGRGGTTVWYDEDDKVTFEWKEGSVFALPPNLKHQHFNGQGNEPVRLFGVTIAPILHNFLHNDEFIFNNNFKFTDRFGGSKDHFNGEGQSYPGRIWETNFIADVMDFPLETWNARGAGGKNAMLELGDCSLASHISEFPIGTYKKAHRHGPGAHVVVVSGKGYSLLWNEGEEDNKRRVDWEAGSLLVPPNQTFHQHFSTSQEPARYFAFRWGSMKHPTPPFQPDGAATSVKEGGNQIEYDDEDPAILALFEEECAKNGIECKMAPFFSKNK